MSKDLALPAGAAGSKDLGGGGKKTLMGQAKAVKFAGILQAKAKATAEATTGERKGSKDGPGRGGSKELGIGNQTMERLDQLVALEQSGVQVRMMKKDRIALQRKKEEEAAEAARKAQELIDNPFGDLAHASYKFHPKPLMVRSLLQSARRIAAREWGEQAPRLSLLEKLVRTIAIIESEESTRSEVNQAKIERKELETAAKKCLKPEEFAEISLTYKRLQYRVGLLERRRARLAKIDDHEFVQLPLQFIEAARDGDEEYCRLCADAGVCLDAHDDRGVTALIQATVANKVETARLLLTRRADPGAQDLNGATALHYSVQMSRFQILNACCDCMTAKRSWNALIYQDARGLTVIDYARQPGKEDMLQLLKQRTGGPLGLMYQVFRGWWYNKLPEDLRNQKGGLAGAAAMAARRKAQNKARRALEAAKEKAKKRLLEVRGGFLCQLCWPEPEEHEVAAEIEQQALLDEDEDEDEEEEDEEEL
eukprot:TRINITY_DN7333_c0_g2_i1.p1 TRINITY_DN7333_c0_g2~~TRINITY_DN7333_c0_g2_i1.p1  ORF type:complete len:481 (+),score=130.63 TRINITY_DN7333_c0_g2_i1:52-1494(+)